jgi:hypothetical protein
VRGKSVYLFRRRQSVVSLSSTTNRGPHPLILRFPKDALPSPAHGRGAGGEGTNQTFLLGIK